MLRVIATWPVFLFVRVMSAVLMLSAAAAFLASMGVLFSLDYDVDVGGGVGWANYGVRTGVGIGLFLAAFGFGAGGGFLWDVVSKPATKRGSDERSDWSPGNHRYRPE